MAKIAIVLNTSWNIYNFRLPLMNRLKADGHEVIAIAPRDEYSERIPFEYKAIDFSSKSVNPFDNLKHLYRFIRLFKEIRPDIALLYTIKPNTYGNIAARLVGVKTISNIAGLGNLFIDHRFVTKIAKWLYRIALTHPQKVFFQNKADMSLFIENNLVDKGLAERIPGSGVDLNRFKPNPNIERQPGQPFVFLMACRMLWEKGVREFVEAGRQILETRPDVVFKLAGPLAVDNPTAINTEEMQDLTTGHNIEYLGVSDHMENELMTADCFVLPSYREGLSKVLLEAAAMAKPIITTRVPGCQDVVEDQVNGFLCDSESVDDLALKMKAMLELSAEQRQRMGAEGRAKVEREYDQDFVIERYIQVVNEITLHH